MPPGFSGADFVYPLPEENIESAIRPSPALVAVVAVAAVGTIAFGLYPRFLF